MLAGPWTNVSVPAPTRHVVYRSASLELANSAWSFESPSGAYAPRGTQYLYVNASVVNTGLSTMTVNPLSFEAVWNGTGVAQAGAANWAPVTLPPGGAATLLVAFLSLSPAAPDSVRLVVG